METNLSLLDYMPGAKLYNIQYTVQSNLYIAVESQKACIKLELSVCVYQHYT